MADEKEKVQLDRKQVWDLAMARITGDPKLKLEAALKQAAIEMLAISGRRVVLDVEKVKDGGEKHIEIAVIDFDADPILIESVEKDGRVMSGLEALAKALR